MTNQNKKSFKQVVTKEYKAIIFLIIVAGLIPLILELIQLFDIIRFSNLGLLGEVQVLIGKANFTYLDNHTKLIIEGIAGLVLIPTIPLVMARLIGGQKISASLKGGFSDYSNKRTWNYILKVLAPAILVSAAAYLLLISLPDSITASFFHNFIQSLALRIITIVISVIILTLLMTLSGVILVSNIVYMRGSDRIKDTFKAIPNHEINKLLIFNLINSTLGIMSIVLLVEIFLHMTFMQFYKNFYNLIIVFMVIMIIYGVIVSYLKMALYFNVASKVPFKQSKLETNQTDQTSILEGNDDSVVVSVENKNKELSIKPKSAKRPNRLNSTNNPFEQNK